MFMVLSWNHYIVSQRFRLENPCKWKKGPRRCRYTRVCFLGCSRVLEVPELLNFQSNLKTPKHKAHTNTSHLPTCPQRPPAGIGECVRSFKFTHLCTHYTSLTHRLPIFFTSTALVPALYPDLKGVFFPPPLYFIPPILSLSLVCLAGNPPTHCMNMLAHKHRF